MSANSAHQSPRAALIVCTRSYAAQARRAPCSEREIDAAATHLLVRRGSRKTLVLSCSGMIDEDRDWALLYRAQLELGGEFEALFEGFAVAHASKFLREAPSEGEHDLEWSALHRDYLALFESTLAKWLDSEGATAVTFYKECRDSLDDRFCALFEEDINKPFVEQMLGVLAYEHFYELMVTEAKRRRRRFSGNRSSGK